MFFKAKKCFSGFNTWKSILDKFDLLKRGLTWIISNGNNINFWFVNWMNDSPIIKKVIPNKADYINKKTRVSDFIDGMQNWNLTNLKGFIPDEIIDRINCMLIQLSNTEDKII